MTILQFTTSSQDLRDGDCINSLVGVEELTHALEDGLMGRYVEVLWMNLIHDLVDRIHGEEDSSNDRLLRLA